MINIWNEDAKEQSQHIWGNSVEFKSDKSLKRQKTKYCMKIKIWL